MKIDYLHFLTNRYHLLMLDEMYHDFLQGKEEDVDKLTHELDIALGSLKSMQKDLQESKMQVE